MIVFILAILFASVSCKTIELEFYTLDKWDFVGYGWIYTLYSDHAIYWKLCVPLPHTFFVFYLVQCNFTSEDVCDYKLKYVLFTGSRYDLMKRQKCYESYIYESRDEIFNLFHSLDDTYMTVAYSPYLTGVIHGCISFE
jgi:hypothetical protein